MKLKELIEKLKKADQEKDVHIVYDSAAMDIPIGGILQLEDRVIIFDE